jgi:hypothetical protein
MSECLYGRKHFFFEKKKQKTFDPWRARQSQRTRQSAKVFGPFFQKRTLPSTDAM